MLDDRAPAASDPPDADVAQRLRDGRRVVDAELDAIYTMPIRAASARFWTPIAVALRAVELLVHHPSTRVLDIGSGVGKFCIVGAAATGAQFTGIEHRRHFVRTAASAAQQLGVASARFIHGTFDALDATGYDALYFFNPFEENVWGADHHLDQSVELSNERFRADIERAESFLSAARAGTRVVTYHGFGGEIPPSYRLALREPCHSGLLELWIKTEKAGRQGGRLRGRTY